MLAAGNWTGPDGTHDFIQTKNMTEEDSDREFKQVVDQVEGWTRQFTQTPAFRSLHSGEQKDASAIIAFFAEYAYSYLAAMPQKWDRRVVRECCLHLLPRKISAEGSFFEAIGPVLCAFFTFLGERGSLANGHLLATTVAGLGKQIVAQSRNSKGWGPAKSLVMRAQAAGIDPTDSEAMQAFITDLNLQLATSIRGPDSVRRAP